MDKEILKNYLEQGLSMCKIASLTGRSQSSVKYWMKKFALKSRFKTFKLCSEEDHAAIRNQRIDQKTFEEFDWGAIQEAYSRGSTWSDLSKNFGVTDFFLMKAKKKGLFFSRSHKEAALISTSPSRFRKQSPEVKAKISSARKKYLLTHPHPWANTKHNYSAPCELLKSLLREEKIDFTEEFQPLREKGRFFAIDIYFPELKLGIEINGTNHYDKEGNLAPYYLDRHNLICEEGISLVEIRYHKIYSEEFRKAFIKALKISLSEEKISLKFNEFSDQRLSTIELPLKDSNLKSPSEK